MSHLTLANGTRIDTSDGSVIEDELSDYVPVPTNQEAQELVIATRRRVADLPDIPERMNTIGVILSYSMFGLDVNNIAIATGLSSEQIISIKSSEAYTAIEKDTVQNILDSEAETVRGVFRKHARSAAERVVDTMNRAGDVNRFAAARDVLDRDGHRPADIVEHRHQVSGGLVIQHVRKSDKQDVPLIDITPQETF